MPVDHNMAGSSMIVCREKLFKVLVIGDLGAGKSSIILRYVNKRFDERYKASIGVDFALKTLEWDSKTVVRLQLWDIAGECQDSALQKPKCNNLDCLAYVLPYTNDYAIEMCNFRENRV